MGGAGGHHLDAFAGVQHAVDHADVGDHAAVGVVDRVEDHGAGRGVGVTRGGRKVADDLVEQDLDAHAGLAGDAEHLVGVAADQVGQFRRVLLGLGCREVDLVQDRDDREVVFHRQVEVGEGLGLDALGRVHQQDRAFAGRERAGDLIGEVNVSGSVDHVQRVADAVELPGHTDCLGLDGDAAFALNVHAVQVLGLHVTGLDNTGVLKHPVGQGGFPVVNVRNDAEVPDDVRICCRGHRGGAGHGRHAGSLLLAILLAFHRSARRLVSQPAACRISEPIVSHVRAHGSASPPSAGRLAAA